MIFRQFSDDQAKTLNMTGFSSCNEVPTFRQFQQDNDPQWGNAFMFVGEHSHRDGWFRWYISKNYFQNDPEGQRDKCHYLNGGAGIISHRLKLLRVTSSRILQA